MADGVSMRLVGTEEFARQMRRYNGIGDEEVRKANLRTGFSGLTSVRRYLTDFGAVDQGGLRASYHLESKDESGAKSYWQNPNLRGNGSWTDSEGRTQQGWLHAPFSSDLSVFLGSNAPHAAVTEYGRAPGSRMPPPDAIKPWLRRHNLPESLAFVVARSIAEHGLPPKPALLLATEDMIPEHLKFLKRALETAGQRVAK